MRVLVLVIILVATALRFYTLGDKSLWGDEIAQAVWSSWDWAQLWQKFRAPPDLVSHFALVHLSQMLGPQEFWTRLPSAITSVLTVPLVYVVAKRLTDRSTALVAMVLVAVAPYQIWYAQEARMYAALGCYALVGLYFFVRLVLKSENRKAVSVVALVAGLVVGNTLTVYTHLFGVFPVLAQAVAASGIVLAGWVRARQFVLPRWFLPLLAGFGLTVLFSVPLIPGTLPYVLQGGRPAVAETIFPTLPFQLDRDFLWELFGDIGPGARETWRTALSLGLAFFGAIALVLVKPRSGWICAVWLALPLLVLALTHPRHSVSARYLIFLQPVYLLLVACAVVFVARFLMRPVSSTLSDSRPTQLIPISGAVFALVGLVLLALVVVPPLLELYPRAKLNDWRATARYIEANARAGDLVFGERNTPNMNAPTYYLPNLLRYDTPPTTLEELELAHTANRRMWYVSAGDYFDPEGAAWARANMKVIPLSEWLEPSLHYAPPGPFVYTQSEHLASILFHEGDVPSEIVYVGRQGFSNTNIERLKMNPGETLETELALTEQGTRRLEIEYASKKAGRFDVEVDGELLVQVREEQADRGAETLTLELSTGSALVNVQVTNMDSEFPLFIHPIALKRAP